MLGKIGIDVPLLTFQIINFLIFILILKKFLYLPVLKIISDRQKEIEEGLALREKMKEQQANLAKERERIVREAQEEVQLLLERKKEDAEKVRKKILDNARTEKEAIIERGKKEVQELRLEMEKDLQQEVVNLAGLMTEKVLGNLLSKKEQRAIIQKELNRLSRAKFARSRFE